MEDITLNIKKSNIKERILFMNNVLKVQFKETYLTSENIKYLLNNYEVELKTNNFKAILDKILHESNRDILYA